MTQKTMAQVISLFITLCITACAGLNVHTPSTELGVQVYNPQQASMFPVTSSLITGPTEAILVDAQFQKNDAQRLVTLIKQSGKTLTTIYISHSDPDFYFGLDVLQNAFPQAKIVATPATVNKISKSMQGKKAYWGPILKDNAPSHLVLPQALTTNQLHIDDQTIDIVGFNGHDPIHTFIWIPSEKTVLGGVVLSENMHIWMADNKTHASQSDWLKTLDNMATLKPNRVIAGHYLGQSTQSTGIINFTKNYVQAFNQFSKSANNAQTLIENMKQHYPSLPAKDTLVFSAKVVKGDIKWPK